MGEETEDGQTGFHDDFEAYPVPDEPTVLTKPGKTENLIGIWEGGMVSNPFGTLDLGIVNFYVTSGINRALFYLYGGPYQEKLLAAFSLSGINLLHEPYSLASHDGEAFQQTALRFKPDVWNTLTVKHTNGTANWEGFVQWRRGGHRRGLSGRVLIQCERGLL